MSKCLRHLFPSLRIPYYSIPVSSETDHCLKNILCVPDGLNMFLVSLIPAETGGLWLDGFLENLVLVGVSVFFPLWQYLKIYKTNDLHCDAKKILCIYTYNMIPGNFAREYFILLSNNLGG